MSARVINIVQRLAVEITRDRRVFAIVLAVVVAACGNRPGGSGGPGY